MVSFFEKLKKAMGIEGTAEAEKTERVEEKLSKKIEKMEVEEKSSKENELPTEQASEIKVKKLELEKPEIKKDEIKEGKIEVTPVKKEEPKIIEDEKKWLETEGELAIDVYQTESNLVIQSAIAGVKPEDLDISIERDIITIKGIRQKPFKESGDYFIQECYWGPFSREVILPVEVNLDQAEATMKDGILTIRFPKILREKKRSIKVKT